MVDPNTRYTLTAVGEMNEEIYGKLEDIEEKIEDNKSTWNELKKVPSFRNLEGQTKVLIWELAKIEEGDSPRTQSDLAELYNVSEAYLSQLKDKMKDFT